MSSVKYTLEFKPNTEEPDICIGDYLVCWGNGSLICQWDGDYFRDDVDEYFEIPMEIVTSWAKLPDYYEYTHINKSLYNKEV